MAESCMPLAGGPPSSRSAVKRNRYVVATCVGRLIVTRWKGRPLGGGTKPDTQRVSASFDAWVVAVARSELPAAGEQQGVVNEGSHTVMAPLVGG